MPFFGGGGASVDLASPPAIGNTTPNTGAFTTLSANNGTITSSSPAFTLAQTWNAAGTTFTALRVNATDTASASGSLLMDLQIGGSSRLSVAKSGRITTIEQFARGNAVFGIASNGADFEYSAFGSTRAFIRTGGVFESRQSGGGIIWNFGIGTILALVHEADYVLAQRVTTNAQTFRLYRTFTDASNYERLGFIATRTTRFAIAAENAGTGASRSLEISFYTSASDPASTDITDGCFSVWKNSGTSTIKLWANDGGTMKSVALA